MSLLAAGLAMIPTVVILAEDGGCAQVADDGPLYTMSADHSADGGLLNQTRTGHMCVMIQFCATQSLRNLSLRAWRWSCSTTC